MTYHDCFQAYRDALDRADIRPLTAYLYFTIVDLFGRADFPEVLRLTDDEAVRRSGLSRNCYRNHRQILEDIGLLRVEPDKSSGSRIHIVHEMNNDVHEMNNDVHEMNNDVHEMNNEPPLSDRKRKEKEKENSPLQPLFKEKEIIKEKVGGVVLEPHVRTREETTPTPTPIFSKNRSFLDKYLDASKSEVLGRLAASLSTDVEGIAETARRIFDDWQLREVIHDNYNRFAYDLTGYIRNIYASHRSRLTAPADDSELTDRQIALYEAVKSVVGEYTDELRPLLNDFFHHYAAPAARGVLLYETFPCWDVESRLKQWFHHQKTSTSNAR